MWIFEGSSGSSRNNVILAERYEHVQNETLTLRSVFDTVDPKSICFTIVIFGFDGKTFGFLRVPRVPLGTT